MVYEFNQPSFTTQDSATYKTNIDSSLAVLAEIGKQFAPREMGTPEMGVAVEFGVLSDGTFIDAQNVTGFVAPASNAKIDRMYFDVINNTFEIISGSVSETPVAPEVPENSFLICQVELTAGMTEILNENIIDERSFIKKEITLSAGFVTWYAGSTVPSGWLKCDGSLISRTEYSKLFSVIGTTFGVGDGSTTFALPDLTSTIATLMPCIQY